MRFLLFVWNKMLLLKNNLFNVKYLNPHILWLLLLLLHCTMYINNILFILHSHQRELSFQCKHSNTAAWKGFLFCCWIEPSRSKKHTHGNMYVFCNFEYMFFLWNLMRETITIFFLPLYYCTVWHSEFEPLAMLP